jgi:glucose/mannose-6-phosphate isomerase
LEKIKKTDRHDFWGSVNLFPDNCLRALTIGRDLEVPRQVALGGGRSLVYHAPRGVLVVGMGGSAISGDLARDALGDRFSVPLFVSRDYSLPPFADRDFLVLASSYSGNTEETLSAYVDAVERGCMVISLSSGGKLEEFSRTLGIPHLHLPSGMLPRTALPFMLIPILTVLNKLEVIPPVEEDVMHASEVLRDILSRNSVGIPTADNSAKKLAVELVGYVPVVYGWGYLSSAAYRVMTDFQENSKVPAKSALLPEADHNEVLGWQAPKNLTALFAVILLRDRGEPKEMKARIEATRDLILKERAGKILEMSAEGETNLQKSLSTVYKGLITSYYLAIANRVDPWKTGAIDLLKKELEIRLKTRDEISTRVEGLKP